MKRERGYCVCRKVDGRLTRGSEMTGTESSVVFPMSCPDGSRRIATMHTHPSGDLRPSQADIRVMDKFRIPICISDDRSRIQCYKRLKGQGGR